MDKNIISVYIPELAEENKPLYLNGNPLNAYLRKHEGDYKISKDDLARFMRNAQPNEDSRLLDDYCLDDLNMHSVLAWKNMMELRHPSKRYLSMDNLDFLLQMGAYQIDRKEHRKPKMTMACLLFLGRYDAIRQKFPHFHLEYINHRNCQGKARWSDRVSTGDINFPDLNVFEFFQIVREKLRATINDTFELDQNSERKSPAELEDALREALANMLIHADYFDYGADIKVTVENLYYTFMNPGKMLVSTTQFFTGGKSCPRNNTLITFFRRMGISERAGTGGVTLLTFAKVNRFSAPEIHSDYAQTILKLWIAAPFMTHTELSQEERAIYEFIYKHPHGVSVTDIVAVTSLTKYHVRKLLHGFMEKGFITQFGRAKATRYCCTPSLVERADLLDQLGKSLLRVKKS